MPRPEKKRISSKELTEREKRIRQLISREYKIYTEEERQASLPRTLYEKACNKSEKILRVQPDKKTRQRLDEAIDFAHLKITPDGVLSLTVLFMLVSFIPTLLLIITYILLGFGLPVGYGVLAILLETFFIYYLYFYPLNVKRKYENSVGSDVVTFVLYIVMFMRNAPSLEGAVKFAAEHITGDLGYELKKLLWDVEVGNYLSMEDALLDYSKKWTKNRPFIESIQLVITSLRQVGEKRISMLEEAVNIIIDGTREQARNFNQRLKLPVTIINALGVILPVMGLVLFPIVAVFLKVESALLFVGYDIILPIVLYTILMNVMTMRPATFSRIDISENPDVPPPGMFRSGDKNKKAWPFALFIGMALVLFGAYLYFNEVAEAGKSLEGIIPAIIITLGIAVGFAVYFILSTNQKLKVRDNTRKIEQEFAEALFQLGNQISGGTPIELSIENSMERIKTLKIRDLFYKALKNMKLLGFTFSQAFFDERYGAVRAYPSMLVKSVMRTVVESSRKGVVTAANAMLSVSRYLKDLHKTQEDVKESLSDTLNSLKFQAFFLTPMISGVVVTLAVIIIRILRQLGTQVSALGGGIPLLGEFAQIAITPFEFILIVAIYMIETSFILGMFINSIENGEDPIGQQNVIGYILLIGFVVFAASLFLTLTIFGPLISAVV